MNSLIIVSDFEHHVSCGKQFSTNHSVNLSHKTMQSIVHLAIHCHPNCSQMILHRPYRSSLSLHCTQILSNMSSGCMQRYVEVIQLHEKFRKRYC
ncbi:hypothetical protein TNIN_335171 [Trichonephila inaurata madagascariensis]|uniref:Uncharacterized protein n=1 Tax=Trichonephila inaurata madagascariensis TaxID=2747483 RepID=A0A8X6XNF7_9ARAC|nr:hypothetical protein TNIN_335171 [Trichonephila inaurata madagascariensis]